MHIDQENILSERRKPYEILQQAVQVLLWNPRLHALRFDNRDGGRPGEELDQGHSSFRRFRVGAYATGKYHIGLQLRWKRADEFDAGCRENLADDYHTEFNFPLSDKFGHNVGFRTRDFRVDGFSDSESLDQLRYVSATRYLEVSDRLCVEKSAPERFNRTDVRLGSTRPYFHTDTEARKVGACAGDDLSPFDQLVYKRIAGNHDVERLTCIDLSPKSRA